MKTTFMIRRKPEWAEKRFVTAHGVNNHDKPLEFDSVAEAEHEVTWLIQHDKSFPAGEYQIVPRATI